MWPKRRCPPLLYSCGGITRRYSTRYLYGFFSFFFSFYDLFALSTYTRIVCTHIHNIYIKYIIIIIVIYTYYTYILYSRPPQHQYIRIPDHLVYKYFDVNRRRRRRRSRRAGDEQRRCWPPQFPPSRTAKLISYAIRPCHFQTWCTHTHTHTITQTHTHILKCTQTYKHIYTFFSYSSNTHLPSSSPGHVLLSLPLYSVSHKSCNTLKRIYFPTPFYNSDLEENSNGTNIEMFSKRSILLLYIFIQIENKMIWVV